MLSIAIFMGLCNIVRWIDHFLFGSFTVSHAPPVGSYHVTTDTNKSTGPVTFDHGSRFTENKGTDSIPTLITLFSLV